MTTWPQHLATGTSTSFGIWTCSGQQEITTTTTLSCVAIHPARTQNQHGTVNDYERTKSDAIVCANVSPASRSDCHLCKTQERTYQRSSQKKAGKGVNGLHDKQFSRRQTMRNTPERSRKVVWRASRRRDGKVCVPLMGLQNSMEANRMWMYVCMYAYVCMDTMDMYEWIQWICMNMWICVWTYIYVCVYTCMYMYLYARMYIIEGSLEVKLPTIWTDEKQSRAEAERRGRLEERRSEEKESGRKKMQMREKVGKSRNTVFPMICGSGGSKSRLAKAAGAEPAGHCTPSWREAHFEVKMCKTHQVRTTFGSWDVEKVHAVVARSTFPSQKC